MTSISSFTYWQEINSIATNLVHEAMQDNENVKDEAWEQIIDTGLHEAIDQHEWVIYTHNNLQVLQFSDNAEYMVDEMGADGAGQVLKENGLSGLHAALAFWAMYADVQSVLERAFEKYEAENNL